MPTSLLKGTFWGINSLSAGPHIWDQITCLDLFSKIKNVRKVLRPDSESWDQGGSNGVEFFEKILKIEKIVKENVNKNSK